MAFLEAKHLAGQEKSKIQYLVAHPQQFQTKENQAAAEIYQTAAQQVVISPGFKFFIEGGRWEVIRALGRDVRLAVKQMP